MARGLAKILSSDDLATGAGAAAALVAQEQGADVLLVTKLRLGDSNTVMAQGGIQALSRSLYARMIPRGHTAEFFGFYNMLGKFAAILGPLMIGLVGAMTGSPRAGILSLLVLFMAGAMLLIRVNPDMADRS